MGINNLLPFLRPITTNVTLERYKGCRLGVDTMCWMHRGAVACAVELAKGEDSDKFLRYVVHMIQLLLYNSIKPVLVFDGDNVPAKKGEDVERKRKRSEAQSEALRLLTTEKRHEKDQEVQNICTKSISITSAMVDRVIKMCRVLGVEIVVAPYEADAQLAFMCRSGYVAAVISEDSDLLAYGCPHVLYKLEKNGCGQEIDISMIADLLPNVNENLKRNESSENSDVLYTWKGELASLRNFNQKLFAGMCVLSGCDYIGSRIKGMGIKTAYSLMSRYKSLSTVLREISFDPKWKSRLPKGPDYVAVSDEYKNALTVFLRHIVYDVRKKKLTNIGSSYCVEPTIDSKVPVETLVGSYRPNFDQVAEGVINPRTNSPRCQTLTKADMLVIDTYRRSANRNIHNQMSVKAAATPLKSAGCLEKTALETQENVKNLVDDILSGDTNREPNQDEDSANHEQCYSRATTTSGLPYTIKCYYGEKESPRSPYSVENNGISEPCFAEHLPLSKKPKCYVDPFVNSFSVGRIQQQLVKNFSMDIASQNASEFFPKVSELRSNNAAIRRLPSAPSAFKLLDKTGN